MLPERNDDDTLTKSELEVIRSQAARAADVPLLDKVAGIIATLRAERTTNHWVAKSRQAFRDQSNDAA
ncbi:MAG: hypothetical protein JWO98_5342 [Frankiales bacterium]|nr:hypothetical protein [Frankiales bacterium]